MPTGPNALRWVDALLGVLRDAGLPEQVIAYAVDILPLYANATAYEESLYRALGLPDQGEEYIAELRRYFQSLPADRFPNVVAMAVPLTTAGDDDRFEFGANDDFQLKQAINHLKGLPVIASNRAQTAVSTQPATAVPAK